MSSHTFTELRSIKKFERHIRLGFRLLCLSLGFLYLYGILYLVFTPDEGSPEDSRSAWCQESHPKLKYSECTDVAGW